MLDGHSTVVWQGSLYIWGGKAAPSMAHRAPHTPPQYYTNELYVIDAHDVIRQSTVEMHLVRVTGEPDRSDIPHGRAYHCAVVHGGRHMFITGGLTDDAEVGGEASNLHLPCLDLERRVWQRRTTFGDVPVPRCHHVCVAYGDTIFLHGGYPLLPDRQKDVTPEEMARMQHAMYDVHELNVTTLRWRRVQVTHSPALWGHSAVLFSRSVVVFGGVDVMENAESSALAVWHTEKKQWRWSDFQGFEFSCAMHTAVEESGKMYVFGGMKFQDQRRLSSFHEFNLEYGKWRELHPSANPPLGRIGHSSVAYNGCIFVIGGAVEDVQGRADSSSYSSPSAAGVAEKVVHVYNINLNEWHACAIVGQPHSQQHTASSLPFDARRDPLPPPSTGGPGRDQRTVQDADWESSAARVREGINRARAIQQLSQSAMQQVDDSHRTRKEDDGASPSRVVPYDDTRRRQHQAAPGADEAAPVSRQMMPDYATYPEPYATSEERVKEALSAAEARRIIEFQQKEIERLRSERDQLQNTALSAAGGLRNPYEVPVFNMRASSAAREQQQGTGTAESTRDLVGELIPRVNLSLADPPRAVGGGTSHAGYMTRSAVSNLVASALNQRPSSTDAAVTRPQLQPSSIDPMQYLMRPGSLANSAAARQNTMRGYDDLLLARNPPPTGAASAHVGEQGIAYVSPEHASRVPLTLQPLLNLIAGVPPAGGGVTKAPTADGVAYHTATTPTAAAAAAPPPTSSPSFNSTSKRRSNASLAGLLSGRSSMLQI